MRFGGQVAGVTKEHRVRDPAASPTQRWPNPWRNRGAAGEWAAPNGAAVRRHTGDRATTIRIKKQPPAHDRTLYAMTTYSSAPSTRCMALAIGRTHAYAHETGSLFATAPHLAASHANTQLVALPHWGNIVQTRAQDTYTHPHPHTTHTRRHIFRSQTTAVHRHSGRTICTCGHQLWRPKICARAE